MNIRRFTIKFDFEVEWPDEVPSEVVARLEQGAAHSGYPPAGDLVAIANALLAAGKRDPALMQQTLNYFMLGHVSDLKHGGRLNIDQAFDESQGAIASLASSGGEQCVSLLKKHDGDISGLTESIKVSMVDAAIVETV